MIFVIDRENLLTYHYQDSYEDPKISLQYLGCSELAKCTIFSMFLKASLSLLHLPMFLASCLATRPCTLYLFHKEQFGLLAIFQVYKVLSCLSAFAHAVSLTGIFFSSSLPDELFTYLQGPNKMSSPV